MTGWSGLASGRSGSGGFRGVEKILGQNATAFVRVRRPQNAVGGSGAVPRVSEVALAARQAVSVVGRREYRTTAISPIFKVILRFDSSAQRSAGNAVRDLQRARERCYSR